MNLKSSILVISTEGLCKVTGNHVERSAAARNIRILSVYFLQTSEDSSLPALLRLTVCVVRLVPEQWLLSLSDTLIVRVTYMYTIKVVISWKWSRQRRCYYRPVNDLSIAASPMTLSDLQRHSPIASLQVAFFIQLWESWHHFNWHSSSHGPSALAEPLIV